MTITLKNIAPVSMDRGLNIGDDKSMNSRPIEGLRVLCCIPHFYLGDHDKSTASLSEHSRMMTSRKSFSQQPEVRRAYVENTVSSCRALESLPLVDRVEVAVCSVSGFSLISADRLLDPESPEYLVSETLEYMITRSGDFDYFVLVEDDINFSPDVFLNVVEFDSKSLVNEVLHPNRIEYRDGEPFAIDLKTLGVWTTQHLKFNGRNIAIHSNPHSAIMILSRDKFRYCIDRADTKFRGRLRFGGFSGGPMASTFANFLASVALYRPYEDLDFHYVIHQDAFVMPKSQLDFLLRLGPVGREIARTLRRIRGQISTRKCRGNVEKGLRTDT